MANIKRIRRLDTELDLRNVLIPVDKDTYSSDCRHVTILDLKTFILSGYTGNETYTSENKVSPYWTVGGIIAGESYPNGFTNVPVREILDLMLYPTITTTTTTEAGTTTTTTTTTSVGTTTTTTTTNAGTTTTTTTLPPTTTTTTTTIIIFGLDSFGNLNFSDLGGHTVSFLLTITAFASQSWINCDSPPQGNALFSYTIKAVTKEKSVVENLATEINHNPSVSDYSNITVSNLGVGTTQIPEPSYTVSGNKYTYCGDSVGTVTVSISSFSSSDPSVILGTSLVVISSV